MPHTCETCSHWKPIKGLVRTGALAGQCHSGPPKADFAWPRTRATDHCSQHSDQVQFAQAPAPKLAPGTIVKVEPRKGETLGDAAERTLASHAAAPAEAGQLTLDAGNTGDAPPAGASASGTGNRRPRPSAAKA